MKKELISVIVPVYKVEKYLDRCVASIVNQTYHNLEIILVDDGSPDRCGEMCDVWAQKDDRIRVIHKPNGGLSDARNAGIEQAQGRFLGFVDSDDYITSDMYEYLYAHRVNGGICSCGYIEVDESARKNKKEDKKHFPIANEYDFSGGVRLYLHDEIGQGFYRRSLTLGSYAWNKLYDRSVFNNVRFPKGQNYEDVFIILALLHNAKSFKTLSECKYYYVQREDSITHVSGKVAIDILKARKRQLSLVKKYKLESELIVMAEMLVVKAYYDVYKTILRLPESKRREYLALIEECKKVVHSEAFAMLPFSFKRRFWWKIWGAPLYKAFWNLKRK